jgi:hypothetical protein
MIPNPNRAFDPAIESNQAQRIDRHQGTDLQNGYFMDTRGKANVINAASTFGTTIGGAFQPIAK